MAGGRPGLAGAALMVVAFAVGVGVVIARRPDAVTYPQFWAEDGQTWFADAYNLGAASLLHSYSGYLQTLPRMVALLAVHLSLPSAALLFNGVGIAIQAAPAAFFMSRRFEHVAPRAWVRAALALLYLLIPSYELDATITNAQWHLFILALLVLVAIPPQRWWSRTLDLLIVAMSCLTGPFAVLLLPAAAAWLVLRASHRRWYLVVSAVAGTCLVLQAWAFLHSPPRAAEVLGASLKNLLFIASDRVVLAGSFGEEGHTHVFTAGSAHGAVIAAVVTLVAVVVVAFVLVRSDWPVRIFVGAMFAVAVLGAISPLASVSVPAWPLMATSAVGERYFFGAELAWLVCVAWSLSRVTLSGVRYAGAVLVAAAFASGVVNEPQYPPYADFHPAAYNTRLQATPPGTVVTIPINPGWSMILVRRR